MPKHIFTKEECLKTGIWAMSEEERRAARSRGGKTAQANLRRRRNMQEIAAKVLAMHLTDYDEIQDALRAGGMTDADVNYAAGIIMVQAKKAMSGDVKSAEFIRDTSGQKPVDGLVIGNLDDKPFETIDFSSLTDEQLRDLIAAKSEEEEEE